MKRAIFGVCCALVVGMAAAVAEPLPPCNVPEQAKPHFRKAGESFAPLPLPVTPLRRTEKKRPPAPPTLIGKVAFGKLKSVALPSGKNFKFWDWDQDPNDVQQLLARFKKVTSESYGYRKGALAQYPRDPSSIPIWYFSGSEAISLTEDEHAALREFLQNGGTVFAEACYSQSAFFDSFKAEMAEVFPDRPLRRLPLYHPVFGCYHQFDRLQYSGEVPECPNSEPLLYGLDIGSRTAVFLSKYDLSCGWAGHTRQGVTEITPQSAQALGVNMIVYALACNPLGRYLATTPIFLEPDRSPGDFLIAQVRHAGNWDPCPMAVGNLLRRLRKATTTATDIQRTVVDLDDPEVFDYPVLYLTGLGPFVLSESETGALARYLHNGGFLLADACDGDAEFDIAFRAAVRKVVPEADLKRLAGDHPVFESLYKLDGVDYTAAARRTSPELAGPYLEAVVLDGSPAIMYSKYDMGGGVQGIRTPFSKGIAAPDAARLATNIVIYAMSH